MHQPKRVVLQQKIALFDAMLARAPDKIFEEQPPTFFRKTEIAFPFYNPLTWHFRIKLLKIRGLQAEEAEAVLQKAFAKAVHGFQPEKGSFSTYYAQKIRSGRYSLFRKRKRENAFSSMSLQEPLKSRKDNSPINYTLEDVLKNPMNSMTHERVVDSARKVYKSISSVTPPERAQIYVRKILFGDTIMEQARVLNVTRQRVSKVNKETEEYLTRTKQSIMPGAFDKNLFYNELFAKNGLNGLKAKKQEVLTRILRKNGEDAAYIALQVSPFFNNAIKNSGQEAVISKTAETLFLSPRSVCRIYAALQKKHGFLIPLQTSFKTEETLKLKQFSDKQIVEKILKTSKRKPIPLEKISEALKSNLQNRPALKQKLAEIGVLIGVQNGYKNKVPVLIKTIEAAYNRKGKPLIHNDILSLPDGKNLYGIAWKIKKGKISVTTKQEKKLGKIILFPGRGKGGEARRIKAPKIRAASVKKQIRELRELLKRENKSS